MTTELVERTESGLPGVSWTNEQIDLIKRTIAVGATNDELQLFLYQAKRTGLDPLSRQIHFVKRKSSQGEDKASIQTAIDGYRLVADRTGKYAGSDDYLFDEGLTQFQHIASGRKVPITATVTVWKIVQGERCPFTATARWDEYFPGDKQGFMWRKMPYLMLGKCAEALALRKAFPAELSGLYTNEEMMHADAATPVQATVRQPEQSSGPRMPGYAGKYANKPVADMTLETLKEFYPGLLKSIADPNKADWKDRNQKVADAMKARIDELEAASPKDSLSAVDLTSMMGACESMAELVGLMNQAVAHKDQYSAEDYEAIELVFKQIKPKFEKKAKP